MNVGSPSHKLLTRKFNKMKLLKIIILNLGIVAASSLYLSCNKETPLLASISPDLGKSATVQVFSATVRATRNYVYVDGAPVSGSTLVYGGVFPSTAYAFKVDAGSRTFLIKDTLPATTQTPITFSQSMEAGKSYTIFTYDTITSVKQTTVLNNIVVPTDTTCRLRFANFIYNTTPVANVDVYSYRRIPGTPVFVAGAPVLTTSTPVFNNIATTSVTDFIPYAAGQTDTLYVYATGTTAPLLVKQLVPSLVQTRSYTSCYNGSYKGTKVVSTFGTY